MKKLISGLFIASALLIAAGCAHESSGQRGEKQGIGENQIQVTSISVAPQRPVAFQPWRASMTIKNGTREPAQEIGYAFVAGREEFGRGRIPLLKPNQSIEVKSDLVRKGPGMYRVEGRLLSPGSEGGASMAYVTNASRGITVVVSE